MECEKLDFIWNVQKLHEFFVMVNMIDSCAYSIF